jgi:hypothetical protein
MSLLLPLLLLSLLLKLLLLLLPDCCARRERQVCRWGRPRWPQLPRPVHIPAASAGPNKPHAAHPHGDLK